MERGEKVVVEDMIFLLPSTKGASVYQIIDVSK
jgi:hypothetical protein